jgi:hypothetical protein
MERRGSRSVIEAEGADAMESNVYSVSTQPQDSGSDVENPPGGSGECGDRDWDA